MTKGSLEARQLLVPLAAPLNRALHPNREIVWMVGDGRSGSSWIASLLTAACAYRQLFEPFHPTEVQNFGDYRLNHFQQLGSRNEPLRAKLRCVFEGRIWNRRVNQDSGKIIHDGLLAKDVFATLLAPWAVENFPQVKLVLTVRNPFAVALSKTRKPHWRWTDGPAELLNQQPLVDAHLARYVDFLSYIEARSDPVLNHIAVWAILHRCFFRDFDARRLHIMIYRRTLGDPSGEIERLLEYLGKKRDVLHFARELIERPARYSEAASVAAVRQSRDRNWAEQLSADQVAVGNEILARFGLAGLYWKGQPVPEFEEIAATLYSPARLKTDIESKFGLWDALGQKQAATGICSTSLEPPTGRASTIAVR